MKKSVSVLLTVFLTAATAFLPAGMCSGAENSYNTYSDSIQIPTNEFEKEISLDISNTQLSDGAEFGADGFVSFSEDEAWAEIFFNADEDISGYIELTYIPAAEGSYISSSIGVEVNGAYPFSESRELSLYHRWKQGKRRKDSRGNETLSSPEVICENKTIERTPAVFSVSKDLFTKNFSYVCSYIWSDFTTLIPFSEVGTNKN